MSFISDRIMPIIICLLFFLILVDNSVKAEEDYLQSDSINISELNNTKGYTDIVLFGDRFFAVGTDGRIDFISKTGDKVTVDNSCEYKLNSVFANNQILIAAGEFGTIMYSSDGESFYHAELETDKNINEITSKKGLILAGADEGIVLSSKDGKSWSEIQTNAKGNIISLSSNNSFFIGITDVGEIIKSNDGINWVIKDYNKEYAGYNPYSNFKKILAVQNSIIIIGKHDDGTPSILVSTLGNVWAERIPVYIDDQGMDSYLENLPNDITYDSNRDQFILACNNGVLFSLPTCNKCNEYLKISEYDLNAIICFDDYYVVVGDEFSVFKQD